MVSADEQHTEAPSSWPGQHSRHGLTTLRSCPDVLRIALQVV